MQACCLLLFVGKLKIQEISNFYKIREISHEQLLNKSDMV